MDGFIVIDKPSAKTSHDVVNVIRKVVGQKRVGHTGTLDPFATGVLPIAIGESTKAIQFLDEAAKEYRAVLKLGESTDTQDCTGRVTGTGDIGQLSPDDVTRVFESFIGSSHQLPPMFSAIKQGGVPLYRLARRGEEVERAPRQIEIYSIAIDSVRLPEIDFTVRCSRGTYIRTLAHDIGKAFGCGAHLTMLHRTASGCFNIGNAVSLDWLRQSGRVDDVIISTRSALDHLPELKTCAGVSEKVCHGIAPKLLDFEMIPANVKTGCLVRISSGDRLLAVAQVTDMEDFRLRLMRVFN